MHMILWYWSDDCGLPRAYAMGPADKRDEVRREADRQLAAYVDKRRRVGEDCTEHDFTLCSKTWRKGEKL